MAIIVDDESGIRGLMRAVLESEGYEVSEADSATSGEALVRATSRLDLLMVDHTLGDRTAESLVRLNLDLHPGSVIVVVSGHAQSELASAYQGVTCRFLPKPFSLEKLRSSVRGVRSHGA